MDYDPNLDQKKTKEAANKEKKWRGIHINSRHVREWNYGWFLFSSYFLSIF